MSNLSTLPKGDSAWLLRKAIQRVMQQVSVLETNIGASTTGNSANSQVIFNDDGTLRGDPDLIFNTALNKLVATNLEATAALTVGTSATITGDLTVDTSTLKVVSSLDFVGIGATAQSFGEKFRINGNYTVMNDGTFTGFLGKASAIGASGATADFGIRSENELLFLTNGANLRMTLNSTGLGVGVTPSAWNSAAKAIQSSAGAVASNGITTWFGSNVFYDSTYTPKYIGNSFAGAIAYNPTGFGGWEFNIAASGTAGNTVTFTKAMTLDASGNLLVGTTSASGNAGGLKLSNVAGNLGQITFSNNSGSADYVARFNWGSTPTLVGNITVSSGGTAFNTTSDYRLKESVQPLVGGLARVNALKPSIYKWKTDGSNGEGFLAHELAEVVPAAVTGEKDAVNEDGSIKPQGVDLSKVVPILVAAIKELTARVQTLEAK